MPLRTFVALLGVASLQFTLAASSLAAVPEVVPGVTSGELAGFVWWHGWNDGVDPQRAVPAYEENLAALICDVRRDLDAPDLPVVIGELTGP